MDFRILVLGDTVGSPGRRAVKKLVTPMVEKGEVDFVCINGENMAGGSGITHSTFKEIRDAGVDVVTGGDHIYRKKEVYSILEKDDRILRPANYPEEAVGKSWTVVPARNGMEVGVVMALGRVFMQPVDCPFKAIERAVNAMRSKTKIIIVDIHAEATSEKIAISRYFDGKVSLVFGSHTHVQTADEQILPGGTAYITDCGMCGPYDSILGRRVDRVLTKMVTQMPAPFDVAEKDARASGAFIVVDTNTGKAKSIERVHFREDG